MIRLESIHKTFPGAATRAVDDVSFEVEEGGSLALVGLSGSGKTTTLKMINRLVEPDGGRVLIGEQDASKIDPIQLRRGIGYVFQGIGLFPHWTVGRNVGAVLMLQGASAGETRERAEELLELVGLPPDEYAARLPHELSGGQRQRVGVARALAARPRVLLMDEPFGALDPFTRDQLQKEIIRIRRATGVTMVIVTHDITEAVILADRIGVMRDGRLIQLDTPSALISSPRDRSVARLLEAPLENARRIESLGGSSR